MNEKSNFLFAIGIFWFLSGALMIYAGYWPDLAGFGVSPSVFAAFAYIGIIFGVIAVVTGWSVRRQPISGA
jgi:hypothetical protein